MLKPSLVCCIHIWDSETFYIEWNIIEQLANDWTSPIYASFEPCPSIEVVDGRCCHEFICLAPHCKGKGTRPCIVQWYLDKKDARSTSNMRKHVKICWGEDIVDKADKAKDIENIQVGLAAAKKLTDGSIMALFERKGKGKVTFSTH